MNYSTYEQCKAALLAAADKKYDDFNSKIVNCEYKTLGVRTPIIKKLAAAVPIEHRAEILNGFFADTELCYDTVLFAGVLAARKGEGYDTVREYITRLVPTFGSWAHVDCVTPCLRWADRSALWHDFRYLLARDGQYEKRFYIMIMMSCCLCDEYIDMILHTLQHDVTYGQYYVDMAAAWLLAECLVKYYDKTLPIFVNSVFPPFVHNKAIQKARESYRVSSEIKAYLNTLKIPNNKR